MNNSTMQQPLAFLIQHYHFRMCIYFGILFIYSLFWQGSLFETGRFSDEIKPFNSPDLISNSPYCLPYSSCDASLENLVLDQLLIP